MYVEHNTVTISMIILKKMTQNERERIADVGSGL